MTIFHDIPVYNKKKILNDMQISSQKDAFNINLLKNLHIQLDSLSKESHFNCFERGLNTYHKILIKSNELSTNQIIYKNFKGKILKDQGLYDVKNGNFIRLSENNWLKLNSYINEITTDEIDLTSKMIELNYQYSQKIMTSFRLWVKQDSLYNLILLFENKPVDLLGKVIIRTIADAQKNNLENEMVSYSIFAIHVGSNIMDGLMNYLIQKNEKLANKLIKYLKENHINILIPQKGVVLFKSFLDTNDSYVELILLVMTLTRLIDQVIAKPKLILEKKYSCLLQYLEKHEEFEIVKTLQELKHRTLSNFLTKAFKDMGSNIIDWFIKDKLIEKTSLEYETIKKYKKYSIKFLTDEVIINIPSELPQLLFTSPPENIKKHTKIDGIHYLLKKPQNRIHNSIHMTGYMSEKTKKRIQDSQFRYNINLEFTLEFFNNFRESITCITVALPQLYQLVETNVSFKISPEVTEALKFLSEIYSIDFIALIMNNSIVLEYRKYIVDLIAYAIDFSTFKKLSIPSSLMEHYQTICNKLNNRVRSYKISLNELFCNIAIMMNFENFCYNWFVDGRKREYPANDCLSYYKPFVRPFLSFYKTHNFNETIEMRKISRKGEYANAKVLQSLLKDQIIHIWSNFDDKMHSLQDLLSNKGWKLGELFTLSCLINDYNGFIANKDYKFKHFFSLDCSSSGTQNMSMLLKSKRLAQACSISRSNNNETDIYHLVLNMILNILNESRDYSAELKKDPDYNEILHFSLIIKKHTKKLVFNMIRDVSVPSDPKKKPHYLKNFIKTYSGLLSTDEKTYTKAFGKEYDDYAADRVAYFLILSKMINLNEQFKTNPLLNSFINRKLFKRPVMTDFYNSTPFGRKNQMLDTCIEHCIIQGSFIDSNTINQLKYILGDFNQLLTIYIIETFPETQYIKDAIRKLCSTKKIKEITIKSRFSRYQYKPLEIHNLSFQRKDSRQKHRVSQIFDKVDYDRYANGFTANFLQFCDAIIVALFQEKMLKEYKNVSFFTIHDRFFIEPVFAQSLKSILLECYKEFFKMDLVADNFKKYPKLYDAFIKYQLENSNNILTLRDFNNPNFVKF